MSPKQQRICTCFEVCVRRKCKYNTEITLNVSRVSYDSVRTVMVFFISVLTNIVRFDFSLKYSCHLYKKVLFVFFVVCIACIHFFILLTSFFCKSKSVLCNSIRFLDFEVLIRWNSTWMFWNHNYYGLESVAFVLIPFRTIIMFNNQKKMNTLKMVCNCHLFI